MFRSAAALFGLYVLLYFNNNGEGKVNDATWNGPTNSLFDIDLVMFFGIIITNDKG